MFKAEEVYDIPKKQNIPLSELADTKIISAQMCKKLYHQGKFPLMRIGSKYFAPRKSLIQWLDDQLNANVEVTAS